MSSPIQSVLIDSTPQSANFTIVDEHGQQIADGITPDSVKLHTSGAPFQRARYVVNFQLDGYPAKSEPLVGKISGWYILGAVTQITSIVGPLIVDPYTGAMYSLPDVSRTTLGNDQSSIGSAGSTDSNLMPAPETSP